MAGRIPQHFIDELLNRVDIVDVIDSRVPLRKAGRDYQARCPFHEEKTPSFTVSQNKQFYHCFGCGAHGSAIGFLMEYEHMDFIEAVKELAQRSGMQLPALEQESPQKKQQQDLHPIMLEAANFYRHQLKHHADAAKAVDYLKQRGLTGEIAAEFGIGFAPPGWDNLCSQLGNSSQRQQQLVTTGMAVKKDGGGVYDRFRNRIMFPIRDRRGRVIAFGGRVIEKEDQPKYLNSPESPLFHKGRELYGLFEARQALRQIDRLLVVEGYMDVVALAQHGIRYAVATLGTALTPEHLNPLFRTSSEVVFCFDGDRAGRDAAWKALDIMLPELKDGRTARFMFLPEGEDPDSLVRSLGKEGFEQRIESAISLSEFLLQNLTQRVDMTAIDGRAKLVDLARPKLTKINNTVFKHMLITELANRINMPDSDLMQLLGERPIKASKQGASARQSGEPRKLSPVRTAITLLLEQPALATQVQEPARFRELEEPGISLLVELLELVQQCPNITCGAILEHWRDRPEGKHLSKLASMPNAIPTEGYEHEFNDALRLLDKQRVERSSQVLLRKSEAGGLSPEEKQLLSRLLKEKQSLSQPIQRPDSH
jgi:DNA primase